MFGMILISVMTGLGLAWLFYMVYLVEVKGVKFTSNNKNYEPDHVGYRMGPQGFGYYLAGTRSDD